MSNEELEQVHSKVMAAWDAGDADAWADLFADEFAWIDWTQPEPITTKEGARKHFGDYANAFPDMQTKTIDSVFGADAYAAEVEWTGVNTGAMAMGPMEIPPTNKSITGRGSFIVHVRDGKIVEFRAHPDAAGIMMQMGLMPQP
jgi:steroid delta-isomerase-like uncharacterized protein